MILYLRHIVGLIAKIHKFELFILVLTQVTQFGLTAHFLVVCVAVEEQDGDVARVEIKELGEADVLRKNEVPDAKVGEWIDREAIGRVENANLSVERRGKRIDFILYLFVLPAPSNDFGRETGIDGV